MTSHQQLAYNYHTPHPIRVATRIDACMHLLFYFFFPQEECDWVVVEMRLSPGCVECSLCGVSRLGSPLAVQSLFSRWPFHWLLCLGGRASSRETACVSSKGHCFFEC